ncbi:hypothetical protein CCR91_04025 [Thiorhodovibrio winogradskyi]|nr:hypothetical protein [Thiorhodovibrio winogradskyi]
MIRCWFLLGSLFSFCSSRFAVGSNATGPANGLIAVGVETTHLSAEGRCCLDGALLLCRQAPFWCDPILVQFIARRSLWRSKGWTALPSFIH